ncbi:MAG: sulfatase [Planctomycetota bacterium]
MKCVMVMFDSLNRHMLPPYDAQTWVKAPHFSRLAERSVTFDSSYVCSMPCMPARRDLHTGRPSFLHCGWGPLEPFDDSVVSMLSEAGVYTHLATDHYHYFEDGGATYHGRYDSWECFRGQEGDPFVGQVADPVVPPNDNGKGRRQDWVNRQYIRSDEQYPQTQTFDAGIGFIERNHAEDKWFVQIECFDPHEPFTAAPKWRGQYPSPDDGAKLFDWPPYGRVEHTPEQVRDARHNYAALVTKCDDSLGRVLDQFDRHDLWDDTMLVVWTDHGYLLGEHGWWAKNTPPLYDQVAHTPFFVWDPRQAGTAGQRRHALVQPSIDLGPTLLGFFGMNPTPNMLGFDLSGVVASDQPVRDAAIFGYHGDAMNLVTDTHVYMRAPRDTGTDSLFEYTLMPTQMQGFKNPQEARLAGPFSFTKGMPLLKLPAEPRREPRQDLLFDRRNDPKQSEPLDDATLAADLDGRMAELMARCAAPPEQFTRMGLALPAGA